MPSLWPLIGLLALANSQSVLFPGSTLDGDEATTENNNSCATLSGLPCIIPFEFYNVSYSGCITLSDPDFIPWCSTKVYPGTIQHITGGGHWGHCNENCPLDRQAVEALAERGENSGGEILLGGQNVAQEEEFAKCLTADGEAGFCKPAVFCIGLSSQDEEANLCEDGSNVCCAEFLENQSNVIELLANNTDEVVVEQPADISLQDIAATLTSVRSASPALVGLDYDFEDYADEDEEQEPSPVTFHLLFNRPRKPVKDIDTASNDLLATSDSLLGITDNSIGLRFFDSDTSASIDDACPWTPNPFCEPPSDKYRTMDGRCNHLKEPNYGRAATPFQRIRKPEYSEGSFALPRKAKDGFELPSARLVSTSLTKNGLQSQSNLLDDIQTVLVMQMGQFIDHDITHTPNHARPDCCNENGTFPSTFDSTKCYPIDIPADDPFWKGRIRCMNFPRSLSAPTLKCSLESKQQMNQITHWLDASNIYGSSDEESESLRQHRGGQLKISRQPGLKFGNLPSCDAQPSRTVDVCHGCKKCFFAGDERANEQINLLVMHTLWMREHNRVARALEKLNRNWDDEKLFQETRRIVIAEYQHVIYKEWLPLVVGNNLMSTFGLWPLTQGHSRDYLDTFDPRVTNEFATAAFRFGHSLIPTQFQRIARKNVEGRSLNLVNPMKMREIFFKPDMIRESASITDEMVRGLTAQNGNKWDSHFAEDILNHLFEVTVGAGGMDLVALNVQRGRDHGIPGYNAYRETCSVGRARDFEDLRDFIDDESVAKLRNVYRHVDDVDLFVGGFLERKHGDSILGPTFKCLVADTFARLKLGDRFFYDLDIDPKTKFSERQLKELRKVSMSRILCDNTDLIDEMQPQAFKIAESSKVNAVKRCDDFSAIPSPNLDVFREEEGTR